MREVAIFWPPSYLLLQGWLVSGFRCVRAGSTASSNRKIFILAISVRCWSIWLNGPWLLAKGQRINWFAIQCSGRLSIHIPSARCLWSDVTERLHLRLVENLFWRGIPVKVLTASFHGSDWDRRLIRWILNATNTPTSVLVLRVVGVGMSQINYYWRARWFLLKRKYNNPTRPILRLGLSYVEDTEADVCLGVAKFEGDEKTNSPFFQRP